MIRNLVRLLFVLGGCAAGAAAAQQDAPDVPFDQARGMQMYQQKCAECHGQWGRGASKGPPLLHRYYVPGHHSDRHFYHAIRNGAPAHHWNFGDMAAVPGVSQQEAEQITTFVRWLQQQAGLR